MSVTRTSVRGNVDSVPSANGQLPAPESPAKAKRPIERDSFSDLIAEWTFVCPTKEDAGVVASQGEYGLNAEPYSLAPRYARGRKLIVISRADDKGKQKAREVREQCVQAGAALVRTWVVDGLGTEQKTLAEWCGVYRFAVSMLVVRPWESDCPRVLDTRPTIEVNTEEHLVRDQAITALAEDPRIFFRGNALVEVIRPDDDADELPGGIELRHASGAPRIVPLDEPNLRCMLTERSRLFRWSTDKNGENIAHDVHPPDWLVKAILARGFWSGIRELITVAECPYVKLDGTVMSQAGYDRSTGALVIPCFKLAAIPDRPTQDDAREAVNRLLERVGEFPFGDDFDRTAWIAALLTAIQRPMIAGPIPGFAFTGNKAGCGKGLLVDLVGISAWGGPVPTVSYPANAEEADKVVLSLALGGVQAVHFDNLTEGQFYGGSAIDSALTTTVKGGRLLGQSKFINGIPLRPWWGLSGNNISPGKDANRRWIPVGLRTELEIPYERDDVTIKDLKAHFTEHRGEIVADALMILKAHALAHHPAPKGGPLGSFEKWDKAVRAAVWFATGNDCLTTQRRAAADAPDRLEKLALLEAWLSLPEGSRDGYTVQEALELADDGGPGSAQLRAALLPLGEKGKLPTTSKLAYKLRAMKLENVGGQRFADKGKRRMAIVWIVQKLK